MTLSRCCINVFLIFSKSATVCRKQFAKEIKSKMAGGLDFWWGDKLESISGCNPHCTPVYPSVSQCTPVLRCNVKHSPETHCKALCAEIVWIILYTAIYSLMIIALHHCNALKCTAMHVAATLHWVLINCSSRHSHLNCSALRNVSHSRLSKNIIKRPVIIISSTSSSSLQVSGQTCVVS